MAGGIDPKVDLVFKKLFGSVENKALLISLLRAVLPDSPAVPDPIADVEIMNPYNDQETLDEKLSILDVKARDQSGRQYNI